MDYDLWYFIEGKDLIHEVTISKDENVFGLKKAIHKQGNDRLWNGAVAEELVLLKVCDVQITCHCSNHTTCLG